MSEIQFGIGLSDQERKELDKILWIQQEDLSDQDYSRMEILLNKRSKEDLQLENKKQLEYELNYEKNENFSRFDLPNFIRRCKKDGMNKTYMKKWFGNEVDAIYDILGSEEI